VSADVAPQQGREASEPRFGFWRRSYAMVIKEFIQLRRDRVSFAMIVMIPVMQLLLFGYAINTTPRDLPTAVLLQEDSDLARSILKALQNTSYFRFTREVHDAAEFDNLLLSGKVLFGVEIPRGFERAVRRGDYPSLLVAPPIRSPPARRCRRWASWCRPRSPTISTPAIRHRCHSRSAPMRATTRRRRRASTSCPAWSGPS
jgi:ABC-2 type transport system permease protein